MQAATLQKEFDRIGVQTRRSVGISVAAHLLFFLLLSLWKVATPEPLGLTEITWIDPAVETPVQAAPVARVEPKASEPVAAKLSQASEKFERVEQRADLAPAPQTLKRVDTRLSDRLSSLQQTSRSTPKPAIKVKTPSPVGRPTLAAVPDAPSTAEPEALKRSKVSSAPSPITLTREEPRVQKASVATPIPDVQVDRARPADLDVEARRTLAGSQMAGPVADRSILSYEKPSYPDWAKREGVEGSVMIYFVVLPDGSVKESVMVQKTSGFTDFDENAMKAILAWRFEPLKNGQTGEQWGTIMFHYRLGDAH